MERGLNEVLGKDISKSNDLSLMKILRTANIGERTGPGFRQRDKSNIARVGLAHNLSDGIRALFRGV